MTSYPRALKHLSDIQKAAVEANLGAWSVYDSIGRNVEENIRQKERFLPPKKLSELLEAFWNPDVASIADRKTSYRKLCNANAMKGGQSVQPERIGRVTTRIDFRNYLIKRYLPILYAEAEADRIIESLLRAKSPKHLDEWALKLELTEFGSWATWDEDMTCDPFRFAEATAMKKDSIRGSLGLAFRRHQRRSPALIMVCRLPADRQLFRPTIADAELYELFSPPPIGIDDFGLTKPWPQSLESRGLVLVPRPEAIHRPLTIGSVERVEEIY